MNWSKNTSIIQSEIAFFFARKMIESDAKMSSYYEHKSAKIFDFIVNNYHKYDNFIEFMYTNFGYNLRNSRMVTKHNYRKHYWLHYSDQFVVVMTGHTLATLIPSSNTRVFSHKCDVGHNMIFTRRLGDNITFKAPECRLDVLAKLAPIFVRTDILPNTFRRIIRGFPYDDNIVRRGKQVLVIYNNVNAMYDNTEVTIMSNNRTYITLYADSGNDQSWPIWEARIDERGAVIRHDGLHDVAATHTKTQLIKKFAR